MQSVIYFNSIEYFNNTSKLFYKFCFAVVGVKIFFYLIGQVDRKITFCGPDILEKISAYILKILAGFSNIKKQNCIKTVNFKYYCLHKLNK